MYEHCFFWRRTSNQHNKNVVTLEQRPFDSAFAFMLQYCMRVDCRLYIFFTMYLLCVSNQSFLHWRDLIWLRCCQPVPYELYFRLFFDLSDMVFQDNETFWKLYLFYGRILKYRNYNFSAILYVKTRWRLMCHVL